MFVGICRVALVASHCHSLKDKRSVTRTLVDRVRARFDIQLREVGGQDTWQRLELGFAVVAGEERHVVDTVAAVVAFIDGAGVARLVGERREVVSIDAPGGDAPVADDWVPDEWAALVGEGES